MTNNYGVLACVLWGKQHPLVLMIRLSNCSKQKRFQTLPSVPEAGEQHQWQEGSVLHGKQALKDSAVGWVPCSRGLGKYKLREEHLGVIRRPGSK